MASRVFGSRLRCAPEHNVSAIGSATRSELGSTAAASLVVLAGPTRASLVTSCLSASTPSRAVARCYRSGRGRVALFVLGDDAQRVEWGFGPEGRYRYIHRPLGTVLNERERLVAGQHACRIAAALRGQNRDHSVPNGRVGGVVKVAILGVEPPGRRFGCRSGLVNRHCAENLAEENDVKDGCIVNVVNPKNVSWWQEGPGLAERREVLSLLGQLWRLVGAKINGQPDVREDRPSTTLRTPFGRMRERASP